MIAPLLKANVIRAGAHTTHMLGTLAAGLGMYELIGNPTIFGVLAVLAVALIVHELLAELLTSLLDRPLTRLDEQVAKDRRAPVNEANV